MLNGKCAIVYVVQVVFDIYDSKICIITSLRLISCVSIIIVTNVVFLKYR